MRALVRQDDALVVRLQPQDEDEPVPRPLDPVRADIRLRERPDGRLGLPLQYAGGLPITEVSRRLLLRGGQRQVHDVVRVARQVALPLLRRDHVVRWRDVDLLDARFTEGDAVHVLGRVEKFRDRLQLEVRSLEAAPDADPATLAPALRRDADELDGFLEFLAGEIAHPGLKATVARFVGDPALRASLRSLPAAPGGHHGYAGGLLEHTVGVATIARETAQLHPRLRADLLLAAALLHDAGRVRELRPGPAFAQTDEGRLLGHVHLGLRMIEERAADLAPEVLAELLHA